MPRKFDYQGPSIAIGALPDAEPNGTPPVANRIHKSLRRNRDGDATVVQYGLIMNVPGTVDVTVWVQDDTSEEWFSTVTEVGVANNQLFEIVAVAGADLFLQLTNPAGFATVQVVAEVAG